MMWSWRRCVSAAIFTIGSVQGLVASLRHEASTRRTVTLHETATWAEAWSSRREHLVWGISSTIGSASAAFAAEDPFDVEVPLRGKPVQLRKFCGKAQLVVNIKMDDPLAGMNLVSLRYLTSKYFTSGLRVWAFPTDQGYYEPDVAELIRAKAYQQFGFGQYPAAIVFDKVDVLGKTAHPFYRYLQSAPNPNGQNRLTLNFEKFLVDQSGRVLRRYPRKFSGYDMEDDVVAAVDGKELPPATADFNKAWVDAAKEAVKGVSSSHDATIYTAASAGEYSFRSNYNVYDQSEANTDWAGLADLSFL